MNTQTARWIFYFGTILSLVLFLGLTADTHRQLGALTRADRLTDQVVAGKKVWHKYNCNDCHTILGFGSYYGPDLTMVYRRRGEERIRTAVMTPENVTSWRRMPHVRISEPEMASLVAFFEWVGGIDTNDWPPQDRRHRERAEGATEGAGSSAAGMGAAGSAPASAPPPAGVPAPAGVRDTAARAAGTPSDRGVLGPARRAMAAGISTGAELFREKGCFDCHRLEQVGGDDGPNLTFVGSRLTAARIDSVLTDPETVDPRAEMPNPELTPSERAELVRFLSGLRGGGGTAR